MKKHDHKVPRPLWVRLVFFFLLLSALILVLFQAIFNYSLDRHIQAFSRERQETLNAQIVNSLLEYYTAAGSWSGINMPLFHAAISTDTRLLLYDQEANLIADTGQRGPHRMRMAPVPQPDLNEAVSYEYVLEYGNAAIGRLLVAHPVAAEASAWRQQDLIFQQTLNRTVLWTGLIAITAALFLGVLFSRRLSRPLEEMSGAAVRITRGDYSGLLPAYNSRELNELAHCFNRLTTHLRELEKLRKRSVADISHELRTPLATLRSYLEAVRDGVLPADAKTMEVLLEEVMHLNRITVDMDELARAESAGQEQMDREEIGLKRFISDKAASFGPLFRGKDINLELDLPENEVTAFMDAAALRKILGNLLENAYRYTEVGGTVEVALREAPEIDGGAISPMGLESPAEKLSGRRLKDLVMIKISDTGIGIPEEYLPYIFERFFRADSSRQKEQGQAGSGIGLALVRELTRASGGLIMVKSRQGEGTVFYLYLRKKAGDGRAAP